MANEKAVNLFESYTPHELMLKTVEDINRRRKIHKQEYYSYVGKNISKNIKKNNR